MVGSGSLDISNGFFTIWYSVKILWTVQMLYAGSVAQVKSNGTCSLVFSISQTWSKVVYYPLFCLPCAWSPLWNLLGLISQSRTLRLELWLIRLPCLWMTWFFIFLIQCIFLTLQYVLSDFSQDSRLCINQEKSEFSPFNLDPTTEATLCNQFLYKWVTFVLQYLGIQIPLDIMTWYKISYDKMFQDDLSSPKWWNKLQLSWPDRMDLIKALSFPNSYSFSDLCPLKFWRLNWINGRLFKLVSLGLQAPQWSCYTRPLLILWGCYLN